jgi:membrane protease YdiL (CAAX protease family)
MATFEKRRRFRRSLVWPVVAFELALAVVGAVVAGVGGVRLASRLPASGDDWLAAAGWGLVATVPMALVLVFLLVSPWRPLVRLRRIVNRFVRMIFYSAPWWQMAAVSIAAGVGEEVLFRGAIQPVAASFTTPMIGLAIASLLFGLVHAASWSYFLLATGVGFYLGGLAMWQGEIVSAVIAHALYDYIALTAVSKGWMVRQRPLFAFSEASAESSPASSR